MDELSKKSTPLVRPTFEPEAGVVSPPDNVQAGSLEHRHADEIPKAEQVGADIFTKGGNASVSMKTPEERGQTIRKRTAPVTWQEVHDQ